MQLPQPTVERRRKGRHSFQRAILYYLSVLKLVLVVTVPYYPITGYYQSLALTAEGNKSGAYKASLSTKPN